MEKDSILYEHNVPIYEKIVSMLSISNQAIVIGATGTGKLWLGMQYILDYHPKTLVICPKRIICDNWKNHISEVDTITYQYFYRHWLELLDMGYGLVITDEVQHIGSKVWGDAYLQFKEQALKNDTKLLGLTADAIRWTDGGKNVGVDYFDGFIVEGYDQTTAIEMGILPAAVYVRAVFDVDAFKHSIGDQTGEVSEKLTGELNLAIENMEKIADIFHRHMPEKPKGIIFVENIASIQPTISAIHDILPDEPIIYVHSKLTRKRVRANVEEFNNMSHGFIVAVDILNEGLHVAGVNTLVMFRRTRSPGIYIQQIGRGLASSAKQDVIVFDLVGNWTSVDITVGRDKKYANPRNKDADSVYGKDKSNQMIIYDYADDLIRVMDKITCELKSRIPWSVSDNNILRELYPKLTPEELQKFVPHRTVKAVIAQLRKLGLTRKQGNIYQWSEQEVEYIQSHPDMSIVEMHKHFPNCTLDQLRYKIAVLNGIIRANVKWSEEDIEFVKTHPELSLEDLMTTFPSRTKSALQSLLFKLHMPVHSRQCDDRKATRDKLVKIYTSSGLDAAMEYANSIGMTPKRINQILHDAGVPTARVYKYWTATERQLLRDHVNAPLDELQKMLPGHTGCAIQTQRNRILREMTGSNNGIRRWTKSEVEYVRSHMDDMTIREMAEHLPGRSEPGIKKIIRKIKAGTVNPIDD